MISFQDPRLYLQGTCNVILADPTSGDVWYQTNKAQTNNITMSLTGDPIRAGLGNTAATVITTDTTINVALTAADFSLAAKAAQVGSAVLYNGIAPQCQIVEAEGTSLTVDVSGGAPVAQYGYSAPFCYVTEVGVANFVGDKGTAYPIDPSSGAVSDFTAESGKSYKVWYFARKAAAQEVSISANVNPGIYNFTAQMAVYANQGGASSGTQGTRVGWVYYVIPLLKLAGNGGIVGDQTTPDTTDLSGQAISYDEAVETGECVDCAAGNLAYYIYVPDDAASGITGLTVVGGGVSVAASGTAQVPVKYVMVNGSIVQANYADLDFEIDAGTATGTTVSETGLVTAGSTAGEATVTVSYPKTEAEFTCTVPVEVTGA